MLMTLVVEPKKRKESIEITFIKKGRERIKKLA